MSLSLGKQPPAENDWLCESCGYILNGLPTEGANCPECGTPTRESVEPGHRVPAPIELEWSPKAFWLTTSRILVQKRRFFRTTRTRGDHPNVTRFGQRHRLLSSLFIGLAGGLHSMWMAETRGWTTHWDAFALAILTAVTVIFALLAYGTLVVVTRVTGWLTTKEGAFWGMRLPPTVVQRAMSFHAANYLPVGVAAFLVTFGYRIALMLEWSDATSGVKYLVGLCVLVVGSAIWLFESYVIAMRRIRLANY